MTILDREGQSDLFTSARFSFLFWFPGPLFYQLSYGAQWEWCLSSLHFKLKRFSHYNLILIREDMLCFNFSFRFILAA